MTEQHWYQLTLVFLLCQLSLCAVQENVEAAANLSKLNSAYFQWRMSERPESSTSRGFHRYNDILESLTLNNHNISMHRANEFLSSLKNIPRDQLGRGNRLNYDILENMLTTYIDGFKWRLYNTINPLNMMQGPQRNPSFFNTRLPFYTIGDYENYISRLTRLPDQIDQIIVLFQEAIRLKRTYHNVSMTLVFVQIEAIEAACPPNASYYTDYCGYYTPFTGSLSKTSISQNSRDGIRWRGAIAIRRIVDRFRALKDFLRTEYLPFTRPGYGVWSLDQGREFYQACLKWYLSLDLTPEAVHEIGKQEVERIQGQMKKIMAKSNFQGTISEYFTVLKNKDGVFYNTSEELLEGYRVLITDRINPFLKKIFKDPPTLPLEVKPMSTDGPIGRYSLGSKDGSIPGIFWVNAVRPNKIPKFDMLPLTMHESSPGHHMQFSYNLLTDLPEFRRSMEHSPLSRVPFAVPSYTAFTEGWALYAEFLGEELNIYKDDDELMGRYSSEMFRAARLVVDTGIHYYNWSKEDAVNYISQLTVLTREAIAVEVDRYITWPGQACSYKIGELKIKEMRKFAEDTLGDKFDLSEFHTNIMKSGIVPLDLMERNIKEWVGDQLNSTPESSPPTCSSQINSAPSAVFYILFFGFTFNFIHEI